MKSNYNRRIFLKTSILGTTAAAFSKKVLARESGESGLSEEKKPKIVKRKLGKTGLELPVVSFGVMRADNPNLIKAAMDAGVEHFDTAHGYQHGNNEKMLGEVFKNYPRDSFTIASKMNTKSKKEFLEMLDTSLERLKMDHVDILYSHALSSREEVLSEEILDALQTAKKQGKTRFVGLSTHSNEPEVIKAAIDSKVHEVIETAFNFKQDHKEELAQRIREASEAGLGIVGMKSMAGGRLGKEAEKMHFRAALKWVLKNPHVHTIIPGITNFEELKENMAIMENLSLTKEEADFLAYASPLEGLYCNGCQKCIGECKKHLPIPDMMRAYMYAYGYGETKKAKEELALAGMEDNPCANCTDCTVHCIKGFNIPGKLKDIARISSVPDDFLV